jgi:hypothetical protein
MEDVATIHEDAGDGGERLCETDHAHVVRILKPHVIYSGRGKFMPLSPKSKVLETNTSWITKYFQRLSR